MLEASWDAKSDWEVCSEERDVVDDAGESAAGGSRYVAFSVVGGCCSGMRVEVDSECGDRCFSCSVKC